MKIPITSLRAKLQYITDTVIGEAVPNAISEVSKEYPHSIRLLGEGDSPDKVTVKGPPGMRVLSPLNFNCHEYTFGLLNSDDYKEIARRPPAIFANGRFVSLMVESLLTEITQSAVQDGDFVVYFSGLDVMHSGIWTSGKIRSKWGTGRLWEHGIDEVPACYGNEVCFYHKIPPDQCVAAFLQYADWKGT